MGNKESLVAGIVDNVPAYSNRGVNFKSNHIMINDVKYYTGVKYLYYFNLDINVLSMQEGIFF